MENITEMRKRHEKEITEFQTLCSHSELSDWITEYWAIAHATGCLIKVCKFCGKIVKRQGGKDWIHK